MRVINQTLRKYIRYLWVVTGFLGVSGLWTVITNSINQPLPSIFPLSIIFIFSSLYTAGTYGLITKKAWGWKVTVAATIFNLFYFLLYPNLLAMLILCLFILYCAVTFRKSFLPQSEKHPAAED